MIFIVDARNRRHFASDLAAMYCHRKAVFVDGAGWKLPVFSEQEIDGYDLLHDTMYLLAKDDAHGPVMASARLLTTTGPHLMRDLYSAAYRAALPTGPAVWEVSRYCTAPGIGGRSKRLRLLWETICGIMETTLEYGVDHLIFAANHALLPLALECGWEARTVGATMPDGDDEFTAVVATVTNMGLHCVRDRHSIPACVTQLPPSATSPAGSHDANARSFQTPKTPPQISKEPERAIRRPKHSL